jgi:hypothetical protein
VSIKNRAMKEMLGKTKGFPVPIDPCPPVSTLKSQPREIDKQPLTVVPRKVS